MHFLRTENVFVLSNRMLPMKPIPPFSPAINDRHHPNE